MDEHDPRSILDLEAGDHLLAPCRSREEFLHGVVRTARAAHDRGDRCLLVVDEPSWRVVRTHLEEAESEIEARMEAGNLVVLSRRDPFLSDGAFDANLLQAILDEEAEKTRNAGPGPLWLANDMAWTIGGADLAPASRAVEVSAGDHLESETLVAICCYRRSAIPDAVVERALATHPLVLLKGTVFTNPFFTEGEEEASTTVDRMMAALERSGGQARYLRETIADLREAHDRLRESQRLETVGYLAGGIAHDFNNLLTVIRAQCDLLRVEAGLPATASGEVELIQAAADRAATLTSQLLSFSRGQRLRPRSVHLSEVVRDMADRVDRVVGAEVEVTLELDDDLPPVELDPDQLELVVLNLAANAREAMPDGGTLTLATYSRDVAGEDSRPEPLSPGFYAVLEVSDTGRGIEEGVRARVFNPFFTSKGETGGTGLGLSMAYGFVKQSDGFIFVDSEVGEGATFTLHFPARRSPEGR